MQIKFLNQSQFSTKMFYTELPVSLASLTTEISFDSNDNANKLFDHETLDVIHYKGRDRQYESYVEQKHEQIENSSLHAISVDHVANNYSALLPYWVQEFFSIFISEICGVCL